MREANKFERIANGVRCFDSNGKAFEIDVEDIDLVVKHIWLVDDYGYPVTKINQKTTRLTRLIMHTTNDLYVDHIDGNPCNNHRNNLRIATKKDNQHNMGLSSHNSSGYKGVSFRKDRNKYRAYITLDNSYKHLGYFDKAEDAAEAYDTAARYYFRDFACLNFPRVGENGCHRNIVKRA